MTIIQEIRLKFLVIRYMYLLSSFTQVIKTPNGQHVREADRKHLELADNLLTSHKEISLQEVVHGPYPVCQVHRVLPDLQERRTCTTQQHEIV